MLDRFENLRILLVCANILAGYTYHIKLIILELLLIFLVIFLSVSSLRSSLRSTSENLVVRTQPIVPSGYKALQMGAYEPSVRARL